MTTHLFQLKYDDHWKVVFTWRTHQWGTCLIRPSLSWTHPLGDLIVSHWPDGSTSSQAAFPENTTADIWSDPEPWWCFMGFYHSPCVFGYCTWRFPMVQNFRPSPIYVFVHVLLFYCHLNFSKTRKFYFKVTLENLYIFSCLLTFPLLSLCFQFSVT